MRDLLMVVPGVKLEVKGRIGLSTVIHRLSTVIHSVSTDQPCRDHLLEALDHVRRSDPGVIPPHEHPKLVRIEDEPSMIVGLRQHRDPQTERTIGQPADLPVEHRLWL
jgi:hypothetical protein